VRPPIQEPLVTHAQRCYVCLFSQTRNTTDIIHICIYQSRTTTYVPYKVQQFGPSICYTTRSCFTSTSHHRWLSICPNFLNFSPLYEKITFRPLKGILVFGPFARVMTYDAEVTLIGAIEHGAEVSILLASGCCVGPYMA
jgi:hypothetical protein